MSPEDQARLKQILESFDEAAFIALANKGLYRRAVKDLEADELTLEEQEDAILVQGSGWTVTMPAGGPGQAKDDTKATGITRQILTATLYLQQQWLPNVSSEKPLAPAPSPKKRAKRTKAEDAPVSEAEVLQSSLLDMTAEDFQKWGGKTAFREAIYFVETAPDLEVECHSGLILRLIKHEIEARLMPGTSGPTKGRLLDQMLTTGPKSQHKKWVLTAVLAFQKSQGRDITPPETIPKVADVSGAPRSRKEILEATLDLLKGIAATGMAHPSERIQERLSTLSVSATGAHLPRLSRLLRSVADDAALILARDAKADTARLLDRMAFTFALTRALINSDPEPPIALAGRHRTEYTPVGNLMLAGLGAYPWRTASGFEGLTTLFWNLAGSHFCTWTSTRPEGSSGSLNLYQVYHHESVWMGGGSPENLSRSFFLLKEAKLNPVHRLSGSQKSSVELGEPTDPAQIDFGNRAFDNWTELLGYAMGTYPLGLQEREPLDRVVVLKPTSWGDRYFEEMEQKSVWELVDAEGRMISLSLPWLGINEASIEFMESLSPRRDKLFGVIARIGFSGNGVFFEPLSFLSHGVPRGDRILNPAFDHERIQSRQHDLLARLRKKYGRDRIETTLKDEENGFGELEGLEGAIPPGLHSRFSELEGLLLRVAESGAGRVNELTEKRFQQIGETIQRAGFVRIGEALEDFQSTKDTAEALLWASYLCRLHRQAMSLSLGCHLESGAS